VSERALPRELHPACWWLWALGLATAASRTTNPLLLAIIVAVASVVVVARRGDARWSHGFSAYLVAALIVIAIRVVFRVLLDAQYGEHVLVRLPEIPLPKAAAGIRIGGAVSAEGALSALYDGARLATLLVCFGAANALANAKRLLKATPSALHEIGVAVTVALALAPQLIESGARVRRARRLRAAATGRFRLLRQVVIPVMTDALDRSLALAAAMDARGFGRTRVGATRRQAAASAVLVLAGLCGVCVGLYALLDGSGPTVLGAPALVAGVVLAAGGIAVGGRRVQVSRYRPDPWLSSEWVVVLAGVLVVIGSVVAGRLAPDGLNPSLQPLRWPGLPASALVAVLVGVLPAWTTPRPVTKAAG